MAREKAKKPKKTRGGAKKKRKATAKQRRNHIGKSGKRKGVNKPQPAPAAANPYEQENLRDQLIDEVQP